MSWFKNVYDVFQELGEPWPTFLREQGLDIEGNTASLAQRLKQPCQTGQMSLPDFPLKDTQWIRPGLPAYSFLYYALASPYITDQFALPLPTERQIERIENAVYAAQELDMSAPEPLTAFVTSRLPNVETDANNNVLLKIVVFAYEYRPARRTPHGMHADLCYARTGIARTGTTGAAFDRKTRSYLSLDPDQPLKIPVMPAHYAAFLAVRCSGSVGFMGRYMQSKDNQRDFWIPVHKLFPGTDCLRNVQVELEFKAHHLNEKLRRFHLFMPSLQINTGWRGVDLDQPPFLNFDGIGKLSNNADLGSEELTPFAHDYLVQEARFPDAGGQAITYPVPPLNHGALQDQIVPVSSSLVFTSRHITPEGGECHASPEILNARHMVEPRQDNLNRHADVRDLILQGGYRAQNYLDFTGEGWIEVAVRFLPPPGVSSLAEPLLAALNPCYTATPVGCVTAHSLVCAPDFLPNVGQRAVQEATVAQIPEPLRANTWFETPDSLADQRQASNLNLNDSQLTHTELGACFDPKDTTATAVVTAGMPLPVLPSPLVSTQWEPRSFLPDSAAGLFAPGWDIGLDISQEGIVHLAMHALGSPFLTDSKLCAAQGAFWPAAAPDTTRTYEPQKDGAPIIVPLTDKEIGLEDAPAWDGVKGPVLCSQTGLVEYRTLANTDYVDQALLDPAQGQFVLQEIVKIDVDEYMRRVLCMLRVYKALGIDVEGLWDFQALTEAKRAWAVLSFQKHTRESLQTKENMPAALVRLGEPLYFVDVFKHDIDRTTFPADRPGIALVTIKPDTNGNLERFQLCLGPHDATIRQVYPGADWRTAPPIPGL